MLSVQWDRDYRSAPEANSRWALRLTQSGLEHLQHALRIIEHPAEKAKIPWIRSSADRLALRDGSNTSARRHYWKPAATSPRAKNWCWPPNIALAHSGPPTNYSEYWFAQFRFLDRSVNLPAWPTDPVPSGLPQVQAEVVCDVDIWRARDNPACKLAEKTRLDEGLLA